MNKNAIIIGGGFFGLYAGLALSRNGWVVEIAERESAPMQRASLHNQARVHQGYHYPRSLLTGLRSRVSFPVFSREFEAAIESRFTKLYMVSSRLGKVTANQFHQYCKRIGAPCEPAHSKYGNMVNRQLIDGIFETEEYAFDATRLASEMLRRLAQAGVAVHTSTEVLRVEPVPGSLGELNVQLRAADGGHAREQRVGLVLNCAYSAINEVNASSELPVIDLKHEWTEMVLVEPGSAFADLGITVMCGPFFSLMPYPARHCHSFSHVRYTPHFSWQDKHNHRLQPQRLDRSISNWEIMIRDAKRYIPALDQLRRIESMWEIKSVLPRSESDDSRPILFKAHHGLRNYHCVMGGKIDNVYDIIHAFEQEGIFRFDL